MCKDSDNFAITTIFTDKNIVSNHCKCDDYSFYLVDLPILWIQNIKKGCSITTISKLFCIFAA